MSVIGRVGRQTGSEGTTVVPFRVQNDQRRYASRNTKKRAGNRSAMRLRNTINRQEYLASRQSSGQSSGQSSSQSSAVRRPRSVVSS